MEKDQHGNTALNAYSEIAHLGNWYIFIIRIRNGDLVSGSHPIFLVLKAHNFSSCIMIQSNCFFLIRWQFKTIKHTIKSYKTISPDLQRFSGHFIKYTDH